MATMKQAFFRQFQNPTGVLGWIVGHLMAVKNGERSRWALGLVAPQPGERILEIGFGPGVDVRRLVDATGEHGHVAGIDLSPEMVRHARARNRRAHERIDLRHGSATDLPFDDEWFDAVYSVNSALFWPDLDAGMREVHRVLRLGGRAVVVVQPMWSGATEADALRWESQLVAAMRGASFSSVEARTGQMKPVAAAAAIGCR